MRFTSILLALPLLAVADEGPFEQYKAQFNNLFDTIASYLPNPASASNPIHDAQAKAGSVAVHHLTLDNWKNTLYGSLKPGQTEPEEWWLLITGRNKTCFGRCEQVEKAFNETAAKFAVLPGAPHTAIVNCDEQAVLCNSWAATAAILWVIEMLPAPAPIDIYLKKLPINTTTSETLMDLRKDEIKPGVNNFYIHNGTFHPFNGPLARYGLALPFGWGLWALNVIPSWGMMIALSFFSRWLMNRRLPGGAAPNAAAAGAPPAAPRA
jgi:hypothetical protein